MKRRMTMVTLLMIAALAVSAPVCAQAKTGETAAGKNEAEAAGGKRILPHGAELTVTPAIGLSVTGAPLKDLFGYSVQASAGQFDMGVQATMIGLPIEQKDDWLNKLTLILNMDLAVGGQITVKGQSDVIPVKSGALFQMHALAGYKLEPKQNLYITPGIGLGFTSSAVSGTKDGAAIVFGGGTFDIPLYADLKYFFTDLIGIDVNIINTLGFGGIALTYTVPFGSFVAGTGAFRNIFVLKVGPVFRF